MGYWCDGGEGGGPLGGVSRDEGMQFRGGFGGLAAGDSVDA